jgi:predicted O-methyltransferase YrrM
LEKGSTRFFTSDYVSAAKHFFLTYFSALPHILYRSFLSVFFDPRGAQKFVHQVLDNLDLYAPDPILGSIEIRELVKGEADPVIVGSHHIQRAWDTRIFHELVALAYLMQVIKPKKVFEIGTFVGRTTRLLSKNCPEETEIFTLDLPSEEVNHTVGELFQNTPENHKIVQLAGDSQTFDFSQWYGECDFVWVDGCHDQPFVSNDSQEALKLCRAGGYIGWHDYRHSAWWSGVTRVVRELATDYRIQHIEGTTIACLHLQPDKTGRS